MNANHCYGVRMPWNAIIVLLAWMGVSNSLPQTPMISFYKETSRNVQTYDEAQLGDFILEFGLDASGELKQPTNVVISPLSITSLLALMILATEGESQEELRRALHFPTILNEEKIHNNFQTLLESLSQNGSHVTLNIANGLFLQTGAGINYEFTQKAHTYYNSVVSTLDFKNSSKGSTNSINQWVKESTNGMIPQLFTQPLDSLTTFVAVNTVFFNGQWETPFIADFTTDRDFDTGSGVIQVPMMAESLSINYIDIPEMNAQMAALPYKGGRYAMVIILPTGPVSADLQPLENKLSLTKLNSLISNMTQQDVKVWLPRMRLAFKASLKHLLISLGVSSIFDDTKAHFTRLSSKNVYVDDIVHETVIEVNEVGTKAAAATAVDFNRIGSSSSKTFHVTRPAIFFIHDTESNVPLFWGKLVKPEPLNI